MLVRILTARVLPHDAQRLNDLFRAKLDELQRQDGLVYAKLARRFLDDGAEEVVLFEEWRTPAALWAWSGDQPDVPRLLPGTEALLQDLRITHFEALDVLPEEDDPEAG